VTPDEALAAINLPSTGVSEGLRFCIQVPAVADDSEAAAWVEHELTGYPDHNDVPPYRVLSNLPVLGSAFNGAWHYNEVNVSALRLPEQLAEVVDRPVRLVQAVPAFETMLASGKESFGLALPDGFAGALNSAVVAGTTEVDETYQFTRVWRPITSGHVAQVVEAVRVRAMRLLVQVGGSAPPPPTAQPGGPLHIEGNYGQILIDSPGASQFSVAVEPGDLEGLVHALRRVGLPADAVADIAEVLADSDGGSEEEKASRLVSALKLGKHAAGALASGTATNVVAQLLLQYFGLG
jgi:hypothetical protein